MGPVFFPVETAGRYALAEKGRKFQVELIAVAQANQERLEAGMSPGELAMLRHLLDRLAEVAQVAGALP